MSELLISVRSATEAADALAGGASLIDVKEPAHGPLGRADLAVLRAVLDVVADQKPVSAALGEARDWPPDELPGELSRLTFVKWGLAGWTSQAWQRMAALRQRIEADSSCRVVLTAYADHRRAGSPAWRELGHLAIHDRYSVLLLDTFLKDGTTLLDWTSVNDLVELVAQCHAGRVRVALGGGLGRREIQTLQAVRPDWFAVRGAACVHGVRGETLDPDRVRTLAEVVSLARDAG